ncbi:hypothetical protein MSPP1_002383 [Malassezia sp. CBS 17886]|nr:hypothetical protein MSPP1_002383 [Malassezia sp. CBS 17886]
MWVVLCAPCASGSQLTWQGIFRAPVALKECGHLFCSACIRMHINQPGGSGSFCPNCRQKKAFDSELLSQPAIEAAAAHWRSARPFVAHAVGDVDRLQAEVAALRTQLDARDAEPATGAKRAVDDGAPVDRRLRTRRGRNGGAAAASAAQGSVDYRRLDAHMVECPICQQTLSAATLNTHLDSSCAPPAAEASSARRWILGSARGDSETAPDVPDAKRLTRPQYNLTSEKDLRKMLQGFGLSATGSRDRLRDRHRQWVNLYNANLDASPAQRESLPKLRKQLEAWERAQAVAAASPTRSSAHGDKQHRQWIWKTWDAHFRIMVDTEKPAGAEAPGDAPLDASSVAAKDARLNPRLWPLWRKVWANFVYNFMTLVMTYITGMYSPGVSAMRKDLPVSFEVAQLGTSLYMFGLAGGSLLWGPLSQTLGRRPVFLLSYAGVTLFNLGVCLADDVTGILVCRAFAGIMSASTFCNIAGSIVDMTTERDRIPYNSMFRFTTFAGPPLAALLGAVAVQDSTWRWNLRTAPILSFASLALYALTVAETYPPVLLHHEQMHEAAVAQGRSSVWEYLPSHATLGLLRARMRDALTAPWVLLFEEPLVAIICFYTALMYGLLYGSLLFFPQVWQGNRSLTPVQVGYTYFAVLLGLALSTAIVGFFIQSRAYMKAYDRGTNTPELRIRSGGWAIVFVPVGLFMFAWTAPFPHVHWIVPCISIVCFAFGMLSVFNSWMAYLTDTYSNNTAAVIAINTFCRSSVAGAFPLFTHQMVDRMTFQGAMSMFGGISIPLTFMGLFFGLYGGRIRAHSKHAVYG